MIILRSITLTTTMTSYALYIPCRQNRSHIWILLTMHVKKFKYPLQSLMNIACQHSQNRSTLRYMEVRIYYTTHAAHMSEPCRNIIITALLIRLPDLNKRKKYFLHWNAEWLPEDIMQSKWVRHALCISQYFNCRRTRHA